MGQMRCLLLCISELFSEITDSAQQFLAFIKGIYPKPPAWLSSVPKAIRSMPATVVRLDLPQRKYKKLLLVGHSEGCVVIRRAVTIAHKAGDRHPILSSDILRLFAPAHLGFQPTGWIRACLAVGRVEAIVMPILNLSPAFAEMKEKELLNQIKDDTQKFWERSHLNVLRARVLFGKDTIVVKGEFTDDILEPSVLGKDHVSICKPAAGYERPIGFVIDGEQHDA